MDKRVLVFLIGFLAATPAFGSSEKQIYDQKRIVIDKYRAQLGLLHQKLKEIKVGKSSISDSVRRKKELESQYDKVLEAFQIESRSAAVYLRSGAERNPPPPESKKALLLWYQIGSHYYDGGDCKTAGEYHNRCMNHPLIRTALYDNWRIALQVESQMESCYAKRRVKTRVETRVARADTKAAYYVEELRPLLTDNRPYTSNDIARLTSRVYSVRDLEDAVRSFRRLSSDGSVLARPPFILVKGPGTYPEWALRPEKRLIDDSTWHSEGEPGMSSLKAVYDRIVSAVSNLMIDEYLESRDFPHFIPIYLVGGPLNRDGLGIYVDYCLKVHFRRPGLTLGYHLPYDKSVMVWLASGGGTLSHELIHALIEVDFPSAPGWLEEGIASLYEGADGAWQPIDNYRLYYLHSAGKRFNGLTPIRRLTALSKADFNHPQFARFHAASVRYFAFYLYRRHQALADIYKKVRDMQSRSVSAQIGVIEATLERSVEEIQADWESWVQDRSVPKYWHSMRDAASREVNQWDRAPWNP